MSSAKTPTTALAVTGENEVQLDVPDHERVYLEVKARTLDKRKLRSLEAVKNACEALVDAKGEITVASVARTMERLGLPGVKEQSLRNKEGRDYQLLIEAYQRVAARPRRKDANVEDGLAAAIPDLAVRAQVRELLHKVKSLRHRNDMLHAALSKLAPLPALMPGDGGAPSVLSNTAGVGFTPIEVRAVADFLRNIVNLDCHFDEGSGALLDRHGIEIAGSDFLSALRKIVPEPRLRG